MLRRNLVIALAATMAVGALSFVGNAQGDLTPMQELGQLLYFDENLSEPAGQACASCHLPTASFVDPDADIPVSAGVIDGEFGTRNSPAAAYAMYAPALHYDEADEVWIGGQFWDGRATGDELGDPLADQALGPFVNPAEMANPGKAQVIGDIAVSHYAGLFEQVWGEGALTDVETAYNQVALSIAAFERTAMFGQFNSKYDRYLRVCLARGGDKDECAEGEGSVAQGAARTVLTDKEWRGLRLFMEENNNDGVLEAGEGALCSGCHVAEWTDAAANVVVPSWAPGGMVPPMFTDFTFDNLGMPKNVEEPLDPHAEWDLGLGTTVDDPAENGKFKVMTLRNIGLTAPYGHNGLFKSLEDIVHFYNTRDVPGALPGGEDWPPSEYPDTVNTDELGNLGLSEDDEDALVEFMKTLSDDGQHGDWDERYEALSIAER